MAKRSISDLFWNPYLRSIVRTMCDDGHSLVEIRDLLIERAGVAPDRISGGVLSAVARSSGVYSAPDTSATRAEWEDKIEASRRLYYAVQRERSGVKTAEGNTYKRVDH